jgi:hypothetical protein
VGPWRDGCIALASKRLGVADEVEAVTKAIMADPEAEAKIKQLEHDKFKAILADKDSARKREMAVVQSDSAPTINKIVTPALALGVTGLSFVLFAVLIFVEVKPEAKGHPDLHPWGAVSRCDSDSVVLLWLKRWKQRQGRSITGRY